MLLRRSFKRKVCWENPNERGLGAVDINIEILESIITICPARTIRESLKMLGKREPRRLSPKEFQQLLSDLKNRHQQPDFDARTARHRETVTHFSLHKQPSGTIIVEECNFSQAWQFPLASAVQQRTKEHYLAQQESQGFDEQRKGTLISFDWRICAILDLDAKLFRDGIVDARKMSQQLKTIYRLQGIENAATTLKVDSVRLDHVYMLTSCGLQMVYRQIKGDIMTTCDRSAHLRWLCQYSPIMTRALDLAKKHVGKRLLVYVDDPWIQW